MTDLPLDIHPEVAAALKAGRAVVALESTIITHGMPHPQNVETARAVEAAIRAEGAVPATIALLKGRIKVGLSDADLDALVADPDCVKASGRDLAVAMVRGRSAGTTVSSTMLIAARAGIRVFATGGIGGVHRGAEDTFDISADLTELGMTEVAVVCAGVKSILDIPKTLEHLETMRVPVIVHGSDDFPAFFSRVSGEPATHRLDTAAEIAAAVATHLSLGTGTGLLIANPVPEPDAIPAAEIDGTIAEAVAEAAAQGIRGKEVTPFLLARINRLTEGRSLAANIALVLNNARLAAQVAGGLVK
ncbi:pseudouridine-5'-phosphate glycosidase [Frigidibacter sp. MR17.24]|uniref:pseudouridine-5'-phosphate glycosidase n=1 Tax=Frigidibacter sp. MR17.24 TaxID=3127345 RepID=UPI0030130343